MGFFEAASNLVGLPGSMVRDVIGGENPFDQLLDPFGEEDRLTITESTGLEGIPGFLAEMLLDPLNLLAGVGVAKSLPKLLKAHKAGRGAKTARKMDRLRKAGNVRGGVRSGATRRRRSVAAELGLSPGDEVTEKLAQSIGRTLKGPKRAGLLSRIGSRLGVAGGELKETGRHALGQFRNLPRYSQAVIAPKALGGLERYLFSDPEVMEILMEQALLGGDAGTNEPLNMASPLDMLDINSPEPEFSGPFVGRQTDPLGLSPISAPDLRDEYSAPSLQSGLFLEDNPFGL
ncbi:MAG TPA: hypothetical protein DG761_06125 [Gammaproteobacteria bacterium]|nr:hypothetical protein [Gammaproteobacteria bacterium]|tara:strand:- start:371 stop:1237 length:867 start_codon:yes stop_codon:yes gene_type:complete